MANIIRQRTGKVDKWLDAFIASPPVTNDCVEWPWIKNDKGYGIYRRHHRAHRLIHQSVNGSGPDDKPVVAHRCGNPGCVNPRHLYWADQSDNELDKLEHRTMNKQKLTADDVRAIRLDNRVSHVVAKDYDVSAGLIRSIRCGQCWTHIT